jgi:hypothetical protein
MHRSNASISVIKRSVPHAREERDEEYAAHLHGDVCCSSELITVCSHAVRCACGHCRLDAHPAAHVTTPTATPWVDAHHDIGAVEPAEISEEEDDSSRSPSSAKQTKKMPPVVVTNAARGPAHIAIQESASQWEDSVREMSISQRDKIEANDVPMPRYHEPHVGLKAPNKTVSHAHTHRRTSPEWRTQCPLAPIVCIASSPIASSLRSPLPAPRSATRECHCDEYLANDSLESDPECE